MTLGDTRRLRCCHDPCRHELPADPRLSGDVEDTAKTVAGAIGRGDGERVAGTGRLIEISPRVNGKPAIALRTELDALPIREATKAPFGRTLRRCTAAGTTYTWRR